MELFATFALIFGLEIVLGIDNILVISILVGRLEEKDRNRARIIGLSLAMVLRIILLFVVLAMVGLQKPIIFNLSVRDLVLLVGGMFLLWKAIKEIHHTVELIEDPNSQKTVIKSKSGSVIKDIVLLDAVFSLDSIITAIGLTQNVLVIISAVIVSFCGILIFAKPIGEYILDRPSLKILALSFLITIGVTLFLEGIHQHVPKAYIYLPMGFAIGVELLQMRFEHNKQKKSRPVAGGDATR
jgi:predicted tellurium resistance membrane protein TerC